LPHDDIGHLQHEIDAILRPHHADVRSQVPPVSSQAWLSSGPTESYGIRTGADDSDLRRVDTVTPEDNPSIGVVGGDDVVCRLDGAPFHEPQGQVHESIAVWEP